MARSHGTTLLEREDGLVAVERLDAPDRTGTATAATGPTLVLLHSFGTSRHSLRTLAASLLEAGTHSTALLVDLRGHGETQIHESGSFSYAAMRDDLLAVLEALCPHSQGAHGAQGTQGTQGADLVGHSMGGQIALMAAIARPPQCRSLVAIGAGPCREITEERERRSWERAAGFFEKADDPALASALADAAPADAETFPGLAPEELYADARGADLARVIRGGFFHVETNDAECRQLETPALILVGADDSGWLEPSSKLAALLPSARLAVVEGGGHFVHVERAATCVREIVTFWEGLAR